jgi:UDP-N-acetylmuramoyl-L-alanyl-D-glutamate--2,6-diaminopimelate ligase
MERYLAAKARLFTPELSRHGVVLLDAPGARDLLTLVTVPMTTLGRGTRRTCASSSGTSAATARRRTLLIDGDGRARVRTVMRGTHNLDNVLLAAVTAVRGGIDPESSRPRSPRSPHLPDGSSRSVEADDPLVLVDYAHTPDAVAGSSRRRAGSGRQGGQAPSSSSAPAGTAIGTSAVRWVRRR